MYIVARREREKSLHENILWATKHYLRPMLVVTLLAQFGMLSLMLVKGAAMVLHPLIITVVMGLFFSLLATPLSVLIVYFMTGLKEELSLVSFFVSLIALFLGQKIFKQPI